MTPTPAAPQSLSHTLPQDADRPAAMVEQLRRLVGRNAARWKRLLVLEAFARAVAVPLAWLWAAFLLDNAVHLSTGGR
ncbi:MAG TPA: hypothetical protein VKD72_06000, partial [Gemmataceae bacterium]|nr:hypothetical protein [Gemmataceae bacterium]